MSRTASYRFRLYVVTGTQNSADALANLTAFCAQHLRGRHELEVVDVFQQPKRALADRIFMTPTLVRISPSPPARIVGTLNQEHVVLSLLMMDAKVS